MKLFKKVAIFVIVAALAFSLSACGETVDSETLADNVAAACAENPITQADSTVNMHMGMVVEDMTMDMDITMNMALLMSYEPYSMYGDMNMTMSLFGEEVTETMQTYAVIEKGTLVNYTNTADTWTRQDTGIAEETLLSQANGYSWLADKTADELTLADGTQKINGHTVYVLSCTLTGDEMQAALNGMGGADTLLADLGIGAEAMDLSSLSAPTTLYIDTTTYLPVQVDMTISGMGDLVNNMLSASLGEFAAGMSMTLDDIHAVYTNIGYDPVEVPAVPEEGIETAVRIV